MHTTTKKELAIYTDGACSKNPGPGGWAFVILDFSTPHKEILHKGAGGEKETTNNRMELLAVINALQLIQTELKTTILFEPITVYTDSKYVQQGISEWIHNWKKNNWRTAKKEPVKNQDLWITLDTLTAQLNPIWKWVKGHADNQYNILCDKLAVEASQDYR